RCCRGGIYAQHAALSHLLVPAKLSWAPDRGLHDSRPFGVRDRRGALPSSFLAERRGRPPPPATPACPLTSARSASLGLGAEAFARWSCKRVVAQPTRESGDFGAAGR